MNYDKPIADPQAGCWDAERKGQRKGWLLVHMMCAQRRGGVLYRNRSVWFVIRSPK